MRSQYRVHSTDGTKVLVGDGATVEVGEGEGVLPGEGGIAGGPVCNGTKIGARGPVSMHADREKAIKHATPIVLAFLAAFFLTKSIIGNNVSWETGKAVPSITEIS